MDAKITFPKRKNGAIHYNENKVKKGMAECIHAGNFLQDLPQLDIGKKKARFANLTALHPRGVNNIMQVSINFTPGEEIPRHRLIAIACEYLHRIGFAGQPFLVYQHFDAAHPHLHLVSTTILPNGDHIDIGFIGRDRSVPALKAMEEKYGLVNARAWRKSHPFQRQTVPVEKAQYGKRPTLRSITETLWYIVDNFRFRSLSELNAILKLYNLKADGGKPGGWIHSHGGLLYQMLDEKGARVGMPIKASAIRFNPGLKFLEAKFQANQQLDPQTIQHTRTVLDGVIRRGEGWPSFIEGLRREKIAAVPYIDQQGVLEDLSYVDLLTKQVVKTSELGKGYDSKAILHRLGLDHSLAPIREKSLTKTPAALPNELHPEAEQKTKSKSRRL